MKKRDFLKIGAVGALSVGSGRSIQAESARIWEELVSDRTLELSRRKRKPLFNMSGYSAPPMDTVRIAYIGLGNRGYGALGRIVNLANVEIRAICDVVPEKVERARKFLESTNHQPEVYSGSADAWKKVCERGDIDLVYICTPWNLHAPMCIYSMEKGKHAAVEIPAAITLDECWKLVETSERTRKHCTMLENCCYGFFELLTLNMVRQGYFGDIIHVEGAYLHDIFDSLFDTGRRYDLWRLRENQRNGNLYPTHGLGPVCQILDVNRGDQLDYLVSMSSGDFMKGPRAKSLSESTPEFREFKGKQFGGNINTSVIRTKKGRTIMLQHDVTSPRVYSRIHLVSGTKGSAQQYPLPGRIAKGHDWLSEPEFKALEKQFAPPIVKRIGELAEKVGGHGGMDFLMDWRLIDCLRNGLPLDQDVYDAASWSSITALTTWSVAHRSAPIDVPDFTDGSWQTNAKVDLSLSKGGTTEVRIRTSK